MKYRVVYLAAVVLIAAGMIYAQSSQGENSQGSLPSQSVSPAATPPCSSERSNVQGVLPGSKQGEVESGKASQAGSKDQQPGAMASTTASDQVTSSDGGAPPAVWSGPRRASDDIDTRQGTSPSITLSKQDGAGITGASPDK